MECKTLEGVDSLVHISRGVLIELSFRWISSCLAWCPLIREIAGIWARWSSTISLRFYCALLVHFALQWLPMMASPIAPLLFNITSDMTSSQATTEMYSIGGVITSQWSVMRGQEWGIETSFRLRIMDHLPNTFPSLWVVLFLPWGMHTYVEIFAYIVNIIWVSLEIFLWETIHSSRCEVINWPLREMPWGQHESNRAI